MVGTDDARRASLIAAFEAFAGGFSAIDVDDKQSSSWDGSFEIRDLPAVSNCWSQVKAECVAVR